MQTTDQLETFRQRLHQRSLRLTNTRRDIFEQLLRAGQPLTIQQLVSAIDGSHFVSVYRSVDALLKADLLKRVPHGFKNSFELSDSLQPHHHHATCEACGRSTEINHDQLEQLLRRLTLEAGLQPTKHHFEVYGICADCSG